MKLIIILYIMILGKVLPWGEITGKMSLTHEQAWRMIGFKMSEKAKGVVFFKRNGKQIVRELVPQKIPNTPYFQMVWERMRVVGRMTHDNLNSLIHPVWDRLATPPLTGSNLFCKINMKRVGIPPDWKKLLISIGKLNPPHFQAIYCPIHNTIIIKKLFNTKIQTGIGIFHTNTKKLYHFPPPNAQMIKLKAKLKYSIIFMYTKIGDKHSNSTSKTPTLCTANCRRCKWQSILAPHGEKLEVNSVRLSEVIIRE